MLPRDTNLKIASGIIGYNNKILQSMASYPIGIVNKISDAPLHKERHTTSKPAHKPVFEQPCHRHSHEDEKIPLILAIAGTVNV